MSLIRKKPHSGGNTVRSFIETYTRLLKGVRPHLGQLVAAFGCMILLALFTGLYAYMIGPMLKFLLTSGEVGSQELLDFIPGLQVTPSDPAFILMVLPVFILVVAFFKGLAYFGQFYLMGLVGQRVVSDLRRRMFHWLTCLSPAFFQSTPTGQIISRFASDVLAVEQAVTNAVASYLRDSIQVAVLTMLAFILDWRLALIAFVVMPAAVLPIVHFGKRLKTVSTDSQVSLGALANRLHEAIKGMRIIQVFGTQSYERGRFNQEDRRYFETMRRSFAVRAIQSPVMEFLGAAGLAGTIWYAGDRVVSGSLDPGHFISFFATVMMMYNPIKSLGRVGNLAAAGVAAAERVFELLDEPAGVVDRSDAVELDGFRQELKFEDVCFGYDSKQVLQGISATARLGEVVAIVGPSGAGKSTLVGLVPRFYDVQRGRISIDGKDIREFKLESLRKHIGMVSQEVVLFNDTVACNIAYGFDRLDYDQIREVAQKARADGFIEMLPKKYDTKIGEAGMRLSGGQRQRIAIARALLKNAPILILDEATSSLDSESEQEVQAALDSLMSDRTTIVIAHRLSTVRRADKILVMDQGRIVEQGRHEELLAHDSLYRRLYDLQFKDAPESQAPHDQEGITKASA